MNDFLPEQVIFDGAAVLQATFTAATTGIVTSNGHGFSGGEKLRFTTSDTLPDGFDLATDYYVIEPTVNTFKVSLTPDGPAVAPVDTGTGTHTLHLQGRVILAEGFRHGQLAVNSSGTSTMTIKVQGSDAEVAPSFADAQSMANRWDYVAIADLEDKATVEGDTGLAFTGADDHRMFEINTNSKRWITVTVTAWTQGKLRVGLKLSNG